MATAWMNPLARAERLLTVRLLALERTLPEDPADAAGWAEYLRTLELLTRVLERTQGPGAPALTTRELAERYGVTPKTIRRRRREGTIPTADVTPGGQYRYRGDGGEPSPAP
jgi:Helix-turn-helix domain